MAKMRSSRLSSDSLNEMLVFKRNRFSSRKPLLLEQVVGLKCVWSRGEPDAQKKKKKKKKKGFCVCVRGIGEGGGWRRILQGPRYRRAHVKDPTVAGGCLSCEQASKVHQRRK